MRTRVKGELPLPYFREELKEITVTQGQAKSLTYELPEVTSELAE